jgi:hypothetical protein
MQRWRHKYNFNKRRKTMTHRIRKLSLGLACAALFCAVGLNRNFAQTNNAPSNNAPSGNVQSGAPKHRIVMLSELTIKPGMMNEFLEWAKKDALPLFVKAGIKESYLFTNIYGGDRQVVVMAEVHDSFAAIKARNEAFNKNNGPEAVAAFAAQANKYVADWRTSITETLPELSWRNPKRSAPPRYFVAVRRTIDPFRGPDYESYLKHEYLPLVKKTEASLTISRTRFGSDANEYRFLWALDDLADLDQGNAVVRLVGAATLRKQQQKALAGIVLHTETRVLRLREDISIIPAGPAGPAPNTAAK